MRLITMRRSFLSTHQPRKWHILRFFDNQRVTYSQTINAFQIDIQGDLKVTKHFPEPTVDKILRLEKKFLPKYSTYQQI